MTIAREHTMGERVLILGSSPAAAALGRSLRRAGARVESTAVPGDPPLDPSVTMVVLGLPIRDVPAALARLGPELPPGAILVDLAPLMLPSVSILWSLPPGLVKRFVSSHLALEDLDDGEDSAVGDRISGAFVFIGAPLEPGSAAERVARMWESLGAKPKTMAPSLHDALVALTHHLPILAAASLTRTLRRTGSLTRAMTPGARSVLADATRAVSGPSTAGSDELLMLSTPKLLPALEILEREVRRLRQSLDTGGHELRTLLEEAREFRRELLA